MRRFARPLAAVAGAVAVLGFAPFGIAPLVVVALAVLFALWRTAPSPRAAALLGFLFGLGHFLAGVSWVYVSLHDFGMMPAPIAAVATVGFCVYLALFPALAGALYVKLPGGPVAKSIALAPGLWVTTEWLRGWLLTGFPWLAAGYSQIDTPLAGWAPVGGVYLISLATAFSAGALVALIGSSTRVRASLVLAVVALHVGGAMLRGVAWTTPNPTPVTVALLQGNIPQELKFVPGRFESIVETYTKQIASTDARLVVLPETAIPRFLDDVDPAWLRGLAATMAARKGDVLVGAPTGDLRRDYYNSVVSFGASPVQVYSKSHLVPFGEFVPPGFGWIVNVLRIPLSDFARGGADQKPLAVAGEKVAMNICYEDVFGAEIIRQLPEATLLVNVSNVAWFGDSLAPAQHLEISRMRAYETGRPMLRATNTGVTAIIDPRSGAVRALPTFTEGVLTGEVHGYSGSTPFVRWGNALAIGAAIAAIALGMIGRRRAARDAFAN